LLAIGHLPKLAISPRKASVQYARGETPMRKTVAAITGAALLGMMGTMMTPAPASAFIFLFFAPALAAQHSPLAAPAPAPAPKKMAAHGKHHHAKKM
jgi:hypothetical protein